MINKIIYGRIIHVIIIYLSLVIQINSQDCPSIGELLDKGWGAVYGDILDAQVGDTTDTDWGNMNEFAVYDPNPFVLKVGDYPPIRSWPIVPFYECTLDTMHYLSFDFNDLHGPIRYKLETGDISVMNTYRYDSNFNYIDGYSITIVPPDATYEELNGIRDLVVKYDGTVQSVGWDTLSFPLQNYVIDIKPYQPHELTIELVGASQVNQGETNEYMVKIDGGHGIYAINWYVKNESDNQFTQEQSNFPIENNHPTFYILNNKRIIFYKNEYKYNFELLESYADIIVEVFDIELNYTEHSVKRDTMRVYRLPEPITFINNIAGTENYGHLILNENKSQPISSGNSKYLYYDSSYAIRTSELPFIPNFNSTSQKHHHWVAGTDTTLLINEFNLLSSTPKTMISMFSPTKPASIKVKIDGVEINVGNFEFKDPWHYFENQTNWYQSNEFKNYTSPLELSTNTINDYGGVFLNQGDLNNLVPPYYSVSISQTQTINYNGSNHKIHFTGWSDNGKAEFEDANITTTPVVFTDSSAEVYANHKGSLLSSTENALSGTGQRKMVKAGSSHHLVYGSMNMVWYEKIDGSGSMNFVRGEDSNILSLSIYDAKHPAIDYSGSNTIVAFQEQYTPSKSIC